jgi:hypothetical protein
MAIITAANSRRALLVANSEGGDIMGFDLLTAEFMFSAGRMQSVIAIMFAIAYSTNDCCHSPALPS